MDNEMLGLFIYLNDLEEEQRLALINRSIELENVTDVEQTRADPNTIT